jgi:hypothetical protein
MIVLAHRANSNGINKAQENTFEAVCSCLEQGWGIETDIRRAEDGRFYISHDLAEPTLGNWADRFFGAFRRHPHTVIALNVKELGYEADLLSYLDRQSVLGQIFLFDMELLEEVPGQSAALFRSMSPQVRLAARVSDRGEPVERVLGIESAQVVWLDEFDRLWATESDIRRLKVAGKAVYAISPEIHGFSLEEMRRRWEQFYAWGIDGICTDYSALLAQGLADGFQEVRL